MADFILFTCSDCQEIFVEPVRTFIDAPGKEITAPMLCQDCGHGDDD